MEFLIVAAIAFGIGWIIAHKDTSARSQNLLQKERQIQGMNKQIETDRREAQLDYNSNIEKLDRAKDEISKYKNAWTEQHEKLIAEAVKLNQSFQGGYIQGRAWLAKAYSEYIETKDVELQCSMVVKPNPAWKASETIQELSRKRAVMAYELKLLKYQLSSYEEYFPVLVEYRDSILDETVDLTNQAEESLDKIDPALSGGYLTEKDFDELPDIEKFQLALDRYWKRNKSRSEIGRVYERYIGYLYEIDGWKVSYYGAIKGFGDFGRDLICKKGDSVHIVQCKCWSKDKVIREKHVMQLFGTTILYKVTEKHQNTVPVFVATTDLSAEAELVAKELNIDIRKIPLERYPMIKCNINRSTNEKIYHLPFDQQYDRIDISGASDKCYVETTEEASAGGFRRAYRWQNKDGVSS